MIFLLILFNVDEPLHSDEDDRSLDENEYDEYGDELNFG